MQKSPPIHSSWEGVEAGRQSKPVRVNCKAVLDSERGGIDMTLTAEKSRTVENLLDSEK
jgi:hypothetical protein